MLVSHDTSFVVHITDDTLTRAIPLLTISVSRGTKKNTQEARTSSSHQLGQGAATRMSFRNYPADGTALGCTSDTSSRILHLPLAAECNYSHCSMTGHAQSRFVVGTKF